MKQGRLLALVGMLGLVASGCSSGRDVEVTGEVASESRVEADIKLVFFDVTGEGDDLELSQVHEIVLAAPGSFAETIPLEGDRVLVRAIEDRNGDGACTAGEPWAEAEQAIAEDDTVAPIALVLEASPCPTAP
jgi:hypothetical protein